MPAKFAVSKSQLQDMQKEVAPPEGVSPAKPDAAPPTSLLASSSPTLAHFPSHVELDKSIKDENIDVLGLEKRIGLLSRLVIEEALWNSVGWTKKERVDAAIKAISTIEGTKERLWVKQEGAPQTHIQYYKERKEVEERLRSLLKLKRGRLVDKKDADVAFEAIEEREEEAG